MPGEYVNPGIKKQDKPIGQRYRSLQIRFQFVTEI